MRAQSARRLCVLPLVLAAGLRSASQQATITVDAGHVTGAVHPYLFGHFIEHEYNTIQDGLWAEMLHDRKFEQGDKDRDGVSDGWVPQERIDNRYWSLVDGRGRAHRYFIDRREFYGGGAAQAIELFAPGGTASIYQVEVPLYKGRRYSFYVYLKARGSVGGFVDVETANAPAYLNQQFAGIDGNWRKFSAEFTAPQDAPAARVRIGAKGLGTLWIDSASLMPADNWHGMRRDVLEALRPLRVPIMRYPGGCFADGYHWRNGIGDRDQRPETWTTIWSQWEPNDFGTDEYMALARELKFEPHITLNTGNGTAEEATAWVEYANGSSETAMGNLRAQNGHPEPYRIKYWAVGNESVYNCAEHYIGQAKLEDYVALYNRFRAAIQKADAAAHVFPGGAPPGPVEWDHRLLAMIPDPEWLTMSIYTGDHRWDTQVCDAAYFYRHTVAEPREVDAMIGRVVSAIGNLFPHRPLLAITELNSWWLSEKVDPDYRLGNALYFAGVFHTLLRRAAQVVLSEVSTTLNVQGLIGINPSGIKLTPPYFAYLLYANHTGARVLQTTTGGPMTAFNADLPALDAQATASADGHTLYLAVVNRNESEPVGTHIEVENWKPAAREIRIFELNGKDRDAANPYGSAANVNIRQDAIPVNAGSYRFPAHSVTVLEMQ